MRPALFLDRDGVINEDHNYVHLPDDIVFIDGIFDLCRTATDLGMAIVVVTNQAGIGRGYYTEADFAALSDWMRTEFLREGVVIDAIYHCPNHPEHGIGAYKRASYDRKPNPGMILRAQRDLDLDLGASILVGDRKTDIDAGRNAGVGTTILLSAATVDPSGVCGFQVSSLLEVIPIMKSSRAAAAGTSQS
ncbi:HAD family hydrolase [Breoghania sp. L-A4]|uniref:D-glycero-alpha-D-manno-heptose-1,7-bisphosphate 7-phosphatase n=1 Tax=Breoghania sp. L-A4 TaxID=2304600 RepID=UPI000E35F5E2|nr:HAD family hydrolase [Breoghania sp. L-A4]AXS40634.1 HAD family hydrolase [Breoghania sp. L-A4]